MGTRAEESNGLIMVSMTGQGRRHRRMPDSSGGMCQYCEGPCPNSPILEPITEWEASTEATKSAPCSIDHEEAMSWDWWDWWDGIGVAPATFP